MYSQSQVDRYHVFLLENRRLRFKDMAQFVLIICVKYSLRGPKFHFIRDANKHILTKNVHKN